MKIFQLEAIYFYINFSKALLNATLGLQRILNDLHDQVTHMRLQYSCGVYGLIFVHASSSFPKPKLLTLGCNNTGINIEI